ncbi:tautomerase family protein [Aneurinibacillus danicus]|jgi:4-oxalocrotonate tautomerase|uniref:Tautomerase n=1 Tax=Aneurinibacillus danicus TaxID=267746 RepID=A0A511VC94_9BACL|nr:4-oxalocrotonate tautomerase family protein [Aneurinibacillus danicus]GEN36459.1 tautomerase [Aneurinibacillus danicus]
MPYLNVQILKGASTEQKEQVINGVTKVIQEVLGSKPESTFVVVQEVERENWGVGGRSIQSIQQNSN